MRPLPALAAQVEDDPDDVGSPEIQLRIRPSHQVPDENRFIHLVPKPIKVGVIQIDLIAEPPVLLIKRLIGIRNPILRGKRTVREHAVLLVDNIDDANVPVIHIPPA